MPMSPQALENDKSLGVPLIPVKEIYQDDDFNSRDWFSPTSCLPLAQDIGQRGLVQPITVRALRPCASSTLPGEEALIAKGYKYKLIAGFRRKTAYAINNAEVIPAIVKDAYISDFDCRDINAVENLHRSNLNLYEECRAIRHYADAGWTPQEIADRVNQSSAWVDVRLKLLKLPKEIQEMAAQGHIIQADIRDLYTYRHERDELLRAAAKLRDLRKSGQKRNITRLIAKKDRPNAKKARKRMEVFELMQIIRELSKMVNEDATVVAGNVFTKNGNSLITRVLGWASGEVTSEEMYGSIKEYFGLFDVEFDPEVYLDRSLPVDIGL